MSDAESKQQSYSLVHEGNFSGATILKHYRQDNLTQGPGLEPGIFHGQRLYNHRANSGSARLPLLAGGIGGSGIRAFNPLPPADLCQAAR